MNEVARLRLPISVSSLRRMAKALTVMYGPDLTLTGHTDEDGNWLIVHLPQAP